MENRTVVAHGCPKTKKIIFGMEGENVVAYGHLPSSTNRLHWEMLKLVHHNLYILGCSKVWSGLDDFFYPRPILICCLIQVCTTCIQYTHLVELCSVESTQHVLCYKCSLARSQWPDCWFSTESAKLSSGTDTISTLLNRHFLPDFFSYKFTPSSTDISKLFFHQKF